MTIRQFYDMSTAHLSVSARHWLEGNAGANALQQTGVRCHPVAAFLHGWMMWVPNAEDLHGEAVHADLQDACVEARLCGCDYILFDADAEIIGTLPVYEEDETSPEGFTDEEKAAREAYERAGGFDGLAERAETVKISPETIIAVTRAGLGDDEELCPDCGGLGAFPETGADCNTCNGGGAVKSAIHPEDGQPLE